MRRPLVAAAAAAMLLGGCSGASQDATGPTSTSVEVHADSTRDATAEPSHEASSPQVEPLPTTGVLDYQLGGAYDALELEGQETGIDVVARDRAAEPLAGAYSVCYVNGFQTQPDEESLWEGSAALLTDGDGVPVVDPDWPDERVLDPSSAEQRAEILAVIGPQIEECAAKGFDAVEIDNLDTWTRFPEIAEDGAMALAQAYVELAHSRGLAIGQKNAAEIADLGATTLGFDFAVTEECAVWDECDAYLEAYGDAVLQIEYPDALDDAGLSFDEVCSMADGRSLVILRDRDLVPQGEPGYVYETCGDA